ncbi:MAG: glucosaminidase domain-containing protein [Pseudomonadota bacterium]
MDTPQQFFNAIYADARSLGAPHVQAAIAAAQSAIETGWGEHLKGGAYFGIKASESWEGQSQTFTTHEVLGGQRVKLDAAFRAYDDRLDAVQDYLSVIQSTWPETWNAKSIEGAAEGLNRGKYGRYATDPDYSGKVSRTAVARAQKAREAYANGLGEGLVVAPKGRPQQPSKVTRAILQDWDHAYEGQTVMLAVRGYFRDSKGKPGVNDRGIFDDAVFVVSPRGVWAFNFNVDPSRYRDGIASYKADQSISFKQGIHGYSKPAHLRYPALEQVSVAHITRDEQADEVGDFHMNIHKGSASGSTSSLGCCTVPVEQWDEFFGVVCREMDADGQKLIHMVLLEYQGGHPPVQLDAVDQPEPAIVQTTVAPPKNVSPAPTQPRAPTTLKGEITIDALDEDRIASLVQRLSGAGAEVHVNFNINVAVPPNFPQPAPLAGQSKRTNP